MVKRKRERAKGSANPSLKASKSDAVLEGEISSESEGSGGAADDDEAFVSETPDESRVRLAKAYLRQLEESRPHDEVQAQLSRDVQEQARRTRRQIEGLSLGEPRYLKGHHDCVTSVCINADETAFYSGSKDCTLVKWDVETGTRAEVYVGGRHKFECGGHFANVLDVCLLEQRGLLASVGVDRLVRLWDLKAPPRSACVKALFGHTNAVRGIVADPDGAQFYTASVDKSVKVWDTGSGRCSQTLYGHVGSVNAMDIYHKNRPLTGGNDKSARMWKVDRETHLCFTKHAYPVCAVSALDDDRFVSGDEDGAIHVWSSASKKPVASASIGRTRWVTALGSIRAGNVFFSGEVDGKLRSWRVARPTDKEEPNRNGKADGLQLTEAAAAVQLPGTINAIAVGRRLIACAIGKEHKYGRWFHDKSYKRGLAVVPLSYEHLD